MQKIENMSAAEIDAMMRGIPMVHKFEAAGMGLAPFRFMGAFSLPSTHLGEQNPAAYENAMQNMPRGYGMGTCRYCGKAIMNCYCLISADGKKFSIGSECIRKAGDRGLIAKVKIEQSKKRRAASEIKQEAARVARCALRDADALANAPRLAADKAKADARNASITAQNQWLIDVLAPRVERSGFCASLVMDLTGRTLVSQLSARAVDVCREIYCQTKTGSRRNSAAYIESEKTFNALAGIAQ